jgi:hypothetical protein
MLADGDGEVATEEKAEKKMMRPRAAQGMADIIKAILYKNAKASKGWSPEEVARRAKNIDDAQVAKFDWRRRLKRPKDDDDTPPHDLLKRPKSKR